MELSRLLFGLCRRAHIQLFCEYDSPEAVFVKEGSYWPVEKNDLPKHPDVDCMYRLAHRFG